MVEPKLVTTMVRGRETVAVWQSLLDLAVVFQMAFLKPSLGGDVYETKLFVFFMEKFIGNGQ